MRIFKKIMYVVLALAPVFPLLLFAFGNMGSTNGVEFIPLGRFVMYQTQNEPFSVYAGGNEEDPFEERLYTYVFVEKNTIYDYVLSGVIPIREGIQVNEFVSQGDELSGVFIPPGEYVVYSDVRVTNNGVLIGRDSFMHRIGAIYSWFGGVGLTPPPLIVCLFVYLSYMLFIHVAFMMFDIVVFVPKKVSEMFGG